MSEIVMIGSPRALLRSLWPAWLCWLLLPLPAVLFWRSHDGRFIALCCFFVSCTSLAVCAFQKDISPSAILRSTGDRATPVEAWRGRIVSIGLILLLLWLVFSLFCLSFNDTRDIVAPALALLSIIPSLCIAPYMTLATRKPFAAVVLTLFSVACMKFVAGSVTVLVYGWHATEFGHTTLTWAHPNLIVCSLLVATTMLSTTFYILGKRRFCTIYAQAA